MIINRRGKCLKINLSIGPKDPTISECLRTDEVQVNGRDKQMQRDTSFHAFQGAHDFTIQRAIMVSGDTTKSEISGQQSMILRFPI